MGENMQFTYTLTAKNAADTPDITQNDETTTKNYVGDFAKFHGDIDVYEDWGENEVYKIWAKYTKSNGDEDWLTEDDRIIVEDMNILNEEGNILDWNNPDDIKWKDGKATFSVLLNIKRDTPPDGPFSDVRLGVLLQDNDKIKIDPIDEVISGEDVDWVQATPISTELRYGRLEVANAHGSELLPIKDIEVSAEYYDETIDLFRLNTIDSCTTYDAGGIDWTNAQYEGLSQNISATGTGNLVNGRNTFSIHKADDSEKGPGATGHVLYEFPTDSFLQYDWDNADNDDDPLTGQDNPTARATFGIYKGNERIIYLRETTWR
jgi:MSHA biogenesis protein MshQ